MNASLWITYEDQPLKSTLLPIEVIELPPVGATLRADNTTGLLLTVLVDRVEHRDGMPPIIHARVTR